MNRNQFLRAVATICLWVGIASTIHAQKVTNPTNIYENPWISGTPHRIAMGHGAAANIAYVKKDYVTAEKEYKEAVAAAERDKPESAAYYKTYLVRVYEAQNRRKEAYAIYTDLVLPKEGEVTEYEKKPYILMRYAALAAAMGNIDGAAWAANKAKENALNVYIAMNPVFDILPPFTGSIDKYVDLEAASQLLISCEFRDSSFPGDPDYGLLALDKAQLLTKNDKILAAIHFQRGLVLNGRAAVLRATSDDPTEADALLEKSNHEYLAAVDCDRKNRILSDSYAKVGLACGIPMAKIKEQYGAAK